MSGNGYTTGDAISVQGSIQFAAYASQSRGLTVAELRKSWPMHHHGTISGSLSNLHRKGTLAMLAEKRSRCHVYVLPEFVQGRETKPHGRNNRPTINA